MVGNRSPRQSDAVTAWPNGYPESRPLSSIPIFAGLEHGHRSDLARPASPARPRGVPARREVRNVALKHEWGTSVRAGPTPSRTSDQPKAEGQVAALPATTHGRTAIIDFVESQALTASYIQSNDYHAQTIQTFNRPFIILPRFHQNTLSAHSLYPSRTP